MAKPTKGAAAPPAYDWSQAGATGFEHTRTEDLGIPFLQIVQKGSPEVDKSHKDYPTKKIAGAEVGSIINSVSRQIVGGESEPAIFVPCSYERMFVEWKARDSGGGMVKQHSNDSILSSCTRNEQGRDELPNGNIIVTTAYFFGLSLVEGEDPAKVMISMSSTQLKKARMWLNMAMQLRVPGPNGPMPAPLFSHKYALTTVAEQNDQGSWMGWHIETAGIINQQSLIEEAIGVAKQVRSGARPQIAAPKDDVPI